MKQDRVTWGFNRLMETGQLEIFGVFKRPVLVHMMTLDSCPWLTKVEPDVVSCCCSSDATCRTPTTTILCKIKRPLCVTFPGQQQFLKYRNQAICHQQAAEITLFFQSGADVNINRRF